MASDKKTIGVAPAHAAALAELMVRGHFASELDAAKFAMGYAIKTPAGPLPLTRLVGRDALLASERSTIVYENDAALRGEIFKLFSTNHSPQGQADCLSSLLCCLPQVEAPADLDYRHVFRVLVMAFMDAVAFDVRAMKRSCVHIVQPDGRLIPFESFNLLYRDNGALLAQRRAEADASFGRRIVPIHVEEGTLP